MEWQYVSETIYYKDGSLRDIYVLATNIDDWKRWIDFINQNYDVEFFDRRVEQGSQQIEFAKVLEFWEKKNEEGVYAKIIIDGIIIMCYFNEEDIIENDFSPTDIKTLSDHNNLIDYLTNMSKCLNRHVIVTNEMSKEEVLMSVFHDSIDYLGKMSG